MTIVILVVTLIVSILSFNNYELKLKLLFNPFQVFHQKEYHRIITHAFVHSDWMHLIVNMFVLYSFGVNIENTFKHLKQIEIISNSNLVFSALYFGGIVVSVLPKLIQRRHDESYNAVGASGAVSAVLFTNIFFFPLEKVYFYGIIGIPGYLMGILYLIYSYYMSKKNVDNIAHDAHFTGAVFGFIFPLLIDYKLISVFVNGFTIR